MAYKFKQLRFYNYDSHTTDNAPQISDRSTALDNWCSGVLFQSYMPIVQLGIMAPPGTAFQVNGSESAAIIGYTGLFEIDLSTGGEIVSLNFAQSSLDNIANNPTASLIVDLVYESKGG